MCLLTSAVSQGRSVLAKSVTEARIKANLEIIELDASDLKIISDYSKDLEKSGKQIRYVYPPFGVNLGFPDKQ
jgi:hypothetical protein